MRIRPHLVVLAIPVLVASVSPALAHDPTSRTTTGDARLPAGNSCTSFCLDNNGYAVFGCNYDHTIQEGLLFVNKRNVKKTAWDPSTTGEFASWTSKYGSVSFNLGGNQFVWAGMNEAGLMLSTMALRETQVPSPDERPPLESGFWLQYQLDNHSTIEEVLASDSLVRMGKAVDHYLVCDRMGNCAAVEFIGGTMVAHTGDTIPVKVLTNNTYEQSVRSWRDSKQPDSPELFGSLRRFNIAADRVSQFKPVNADSAVRYAFQTLAEARGEDAGGATTLWSIVFDAENLRVFFHTKPNPTIRFVDMKRLDFSCSTPVKMLDVHADLSGDITDALPDYDAKTHFEFVRAAWKKWGTILPSETIESFTRTLAEFPCMEEPDTYEKKATAKGLRGRFWYFVDEVEFTGEEEPEIRFWAALPINHRGQTARIETIYPEPVEIIHDPVHGNEVIFWKITPTDTLVRPYFYYDFEVFSEEVNTNIDPARVLPYDKESALYKRYTQSETWVEITPEIQAKAQEIIGDETNPYHQAKKIFDWVLANMRYEYPDMDSRGAAISFERGKGDCGEYSFVFSALCRAVGIPARAVVCLWPHEEGGHGWAEFYLPPYGWVPVDPSVADLMADLTAEKPSHDLNAVGGRTGILQFMQSRGIPTEDSDYLFGNLYPHRIIVNVGPNVEAVSEKTGLKRTFRYMQPGGLASYPCSIEFQGISDKTGHGGFYLYGVLKDDFEYASSKAEQYFVNTYLEAQRYDKAESGLSKRVEEQPWDAGAWLGLAIVHKNKGEYCDAIQACKKSIAGQAGSSKPVVEAWARTILGNCYDVEGLHDWAVREYNKVVEMDVHYKGAVDSAKMYLEFPYVPSEEECADTEPHKVRKLENLVYDRKWLTELGCAKACLNYLNIDVSDAWLYGGTGYAFIINIHENVLSNSVGVWDNRRTYELGKNLGYETELISGLKSQEDFASKQKLAWNKVREAIDNGLPCYGFNLHIAEDYVIHGYDDCGYYFNGAMRFEGDGPKLWNELGDDNIGYLGVRIIKPCDPSADTKTVKEALQFAIEHAQSPDKWIYSSYKSGPAGYDLWIKALEEGRADWFGVSYLAVVWSECRSFAVPFLEEAKGRLSPDLSPLFDEAIAHYKVASENLNRVAEIFPFLDTSDAEKMTNVRNTECREAAIEYLNAAKEAEMAGLKVLEKIVERL